MSPGRLEEVIFVLIHDPQPRSLSDREYVAFCASIRVSRNTHFSLIISESGLVGVLHSACSCSRSRVMFRSSRAAGNGFDTK